MADKFGLRAWTINLRTWIFGFTYLVFKTTCIDRRIPYGKALFSSREGHFSLRWIRGIRAIRRRAGLITSERHIGELGVRYLSTLNREDRVLRKVAFSGRVGSIKEKPHGLPMRGKPWGLCVRDLAAVA